MTILTIFSLLFLALWLLRRRGSAGVTFALLRQTGKPRQMQVLERVALGARHSLHLVALQNHLIVVGVSPDGCRQIAAFPAGTAALPSVITPVYGQPIGTDSR